MKLESLWILTNLAYGDEEDIKKMFDPQFNVFDVINTVLSGDDHAMIEQALWFIGNITGENGDFRDTILKDTILLEALQRLINKSRLSRYLLRTMCWVNSNIFRYRGFDAKDIPIGLEVARAGLFTDDPDI